MPNVRLLPLQPAERVAELLATADIHLLPQNPGASDLVLPSKLAGMLASGRPVIAVCRAGTEIARMVTTGGLTVPPADAPALAAAVRRLADDAELRTALGRRARLFAVRNFERTTVLRRAFLAVGGEAAVPAHNTAGPAAVEAAANPAHDGVG
jgi:colanic acid biosynthesis glycosyl transferase WcaI